MIKHELIWILCIEREREKKETNDSTFFSPLLTCDTQHSKAHTNVRSKNVSYIPTRQVTHLQTQLAISTSQKGDKRRMNSPKAFEI